MTDKIKVELAMPLEIDGKQHKADTSVSLDPLTAKHYVRHGIARYADGSAPAESTTVAKSESTQEAAASKKEAKNG